MMQALGASKEEIIYKIMREFKIGIETAEFSKLNVLFAIYALVCST